MPVYWPEKTAFFWQIGPQKQCSRSLIIISLADPWLRKSWYRFLINRPCAILWRRCGASHAPWLQLFLKRQGSGLFDDFLHMADFILDLPSYFLAGSLHFQVGIVRHMTHLLLN